MSSSTTNGTAKFYLLEVDWLAWNYAYVDSGHEEGEWTVIHLERGEKTKIRGTIQKMMLDDKTHFMGTINKCADFDQALEEAESQAVWPTGAPNPHNFHEQFRFMLLFWEYLKEKQYITSEEYNTTFGVIRHVQAKNNLERRIKEAENKKKACSKCGKK